METALNIKICTGCKKAFPATDEYFHRRSNGFHPKCKKCRSIDRRKYYKRERQTNSMPKKMQISKEVRTNQTFIERKIAELDGNMTIGRRYYIKKLGKRDKFSTTNFSGELIQICDKFYTFKGPYTESFLKIDFITSEYEIKEV